MLSFTSGFIQKTLSLLVLLAILPALVLIFYSGIELRNEAIENARREVMFLAQTMREVQKGIALSTHQTLATLARMDEIRRMDGPASSSIFRAIIEENPVFINIAAVNLNGDVFASARPFVAVNLADRPHVQQALQDKTFVAGEYIVTRMGETVPSLSFAYPVLDASGSPELILTASLHLENFSAFFDVAKLPKNSFIAVNDRNGIRLFYHPPREETNPVGGLIANDAWEKAKRRQAPGFSTHEGSDGIRRIYAFTPVRLHDDQAPYMYMWAGRPEVSVIQPANRILARNLLLMLISAGLALAVALLVGGKILVTPIQRLISAAREFAAGDINARSSMGGAPGELGTLARTFDEMADALVQNQQHLRTIADYTYNWEYWIGPDGGLIWVSPSCEKTTGYKPEAFMADNNLITAIVHDEDIAHFKKHLASEIDDTHSAHIDFRITHTSGKTIWIDHHCTPLIKEDGSFLGRRISNRDITDRKKIEKALTESEAQFRSLVEGAPDAIFVQTNFCFAYVNQAALRLFGAQSPDQLVGESVLNRFHPDYREKVSKRIARLNHQKKDVPRMRQIYLRMDGSHVPVEASAVPILFKGEHGALVFVQDITERLEIESRLQQAQKMQAIGVLAGGIAHDFNNILFPIMGLSELLLEDLPKNSPEHKNAAGIYAAAKRAKDLVHQILSFSRHATHQKIPLLMQEVIKEVAKLARSTISSYIDIQTDIQDDCDPVLADPTNMHQVAMNLVTNAYQAIGESKGRITIALKQQTMEIADVSDTILAPGQYILLTVSDTGHGIPPEMISKVFDPYFTTKTKEKGTGLGLALAYGIVREHGGDIRASSSIGKGAAFTVYLPVLEHGDAAEVLNPDATYPTGTERILLVDDEEAVVRMEAHMLERLGYVVTRTTSCLEALQIFTANPQGFDLVITDMAMPDMTGEQVARQLMKIRPGIPVILCTGFSETMTVAKALETGFKGFLTKPIARSDLAVMVRQILDDTTAET